MITKWKLSAAPSDKDPRRFKLKLLGDENDVTTLVKKFEGVCGRPFIPLSRDFNWALYIYNFNETERNKIEELVTFSRADNGTVSLSEPPASAPEGFPAPQKKETSGPAGDPALPSERDFWELSLNPGYTFENFIVGQNNRFAHAAAIQCAKNPGTTYNPLFIYGPVGQGKSHLMHAVAHEILKAAPSVKLLSISAERFIGEVIDSISRGALQRFRDKYRALEVLMLDDIQFLSGSESTQEEFFHIFNILYDNHKQIVLTSDRPPKQLETLEDRLKSRFEWGLIADIKFPNLETRIAILKKKEILDNLDLDDNILSYIASRLKSNIRELEGFLKRIKAYSRLTGTEVNLDMVKNLLNDLLPESERDSKISGSAASNAPSPEPAPQIVSPDNTPHNYRIGSFKQPPAPLEKAPNLPQPSGPGPQPSQKQPSQTAPPAPSNIFRQHAPAAGQVYKIPTQAAAPIQAAGSAGKSQGKDNKIALKPIEVAYFFPEENAPDLETVKNNFREVVIKHKLKFCLEGVFEREYSHKKKVNYGFFVELCKTNKVNIAVVLGPPPGAAFSTEEFEQSLSSIFADEKIFFQMVNYQDISKPYKFLNIALDITLKKNKEMYG